MSQQFHHLFWFGDLNYRCELPFAAAVACAERHTPQDLEALLATDQLRREMREGRAFAGFSEAPITFAPTYKYEMEGRHPRRFANKREQSPSYCDRVLTRSLPGIAAELTPKQYQPVPTVLLSDHVPVHAAR